jgi:hypothetical protein
MNVVFCNGELEPRIVIKQEGGLVTMVKTTNSQDPENPVSHWTYGADPSKGTPWNTDEEDEMSREGKAMATRQKEECLEPQSAAVFNSGGSKAGATVRMVCDDELETLPRNICSKTLPEMGPNLKLEVCTPGSEGRLQVLFSGCTNIQ